MAARRAQVRLEVDEGEDSSAAGDSPANVRVVNSKFLVGREDEDSELDASTESPEASAESFGEEILVSSVKRLDAGSKAVQGKGFTGPRAGGSGWKENDESASSSSSGWNTAKPAATRSAPPAGPPPASMAAAAAAKKPAPPGPPPVKLSSAAAKRTSSADNDSDLDELEAEAAVEAAAAALSAGKDRGPRRRETDYAGSGEESEDDEEDDEVGDDLIRRPIVRGDDDNEDVSGAPAPHSSFGAYSDEKRKSGITLARKSGYYDEEDEGAVAAVAGGGPLKAGVITPAFSPARNATSSYTYSAFSYVLVAHERGARTEHVQCTIYRDRSSVHTKLYPEYQLVQDDTKKPLLLARKMSMNRTSNYHVFDLTRGVASSKLTKKSGNYLGKLRALNSARTEYVLVSSSTGREEVGGIAFERLTVFDQLKAGSQPRKMTVMVPALDTDSHMPVPVKPDKGDEPIASLLKAPLLGNSKGMFVLESKQPTFENGNYRLNFRGRVNLPSVKNFQLVSEAEPTDIICQFGKVNDDKFHLDFKEPLNAFQAFGLALTQFNL